MKSRQIANDLFYYLNNAKNREAILTAILNMETEYQIPINGWYGIFYQYFRVRQDEIQILKDAWCTKNTSFECIQDLIHFFNKGAWNSTSANTYLMSNLLSLLSYRIDWKRYPEIYYDFCEHMEQYQEESLIYILQKQFQNEEIKNNCQQKFHLLLSRNLLTRAFDEFDFSLVSAKDFEILQHQFRIILSNIIINPELSLLNENNKEEIISWEKSVIDTVMRNLLNHEGNIKQSILRLLHCEDVEFDKEKKISLLNAYVGRVISDIIQLDYHHHAHQLICDFITKNYAHLMLETFDNALKTETQSSWAKLGMGAGLIISAATAGFLLFKKEDASPPLLQEEEMLGSKPKELSMQ